MSQFNCTKVRKVKGKLMKIYVDQSAGYGGDGSFARPFKKINDAAAIAAAGDEVIVAPGIYREDVNPVNAGTKERPITYRSVMYREAVITGADVFTGWIHHDKDVWLLRIPNSYFGTYNPYKTLVSGDWLDISVPVHTGEVFINGRAMYEKDTLDKVITPQYYDQSWDRDFTLHTWYTEQDHDRDETVIYANFCGSDPNLD